MKISIHQPYLFPYLGYIQLIYNSDIFVVYDDVTYIKGGHVNRNNILANGTIQRFSLPINGASSNLNFNELSFNSNTKKLIKTFEQSYSKAKNFKDIMPIIEDVINYKSRCVSELCLYSYKRIFDYLGIDKKLITSSSLEYDRSGDRTEKVLSICKVLEGDEYINAYGGIELYTSTDFDREGIKLSFLKKNSVQYSQNIENFEDNLSIIDVLMNNSIEEVKQLILQYKVIDGE
ncbi:WbqC family protein [Vibrio crassostreae]|uniref:WbqC family protein n=1 Tax=Vibrio crassostreae TaxID=246167 RepID=UPI0010515D9D|nr:WbqC family protein [Vibrio crassostreae]TCV12745.1 WbqC-like protein [Vibrio crassostreae]